MKLNEIYALLDAPAPRALSEEYCAKYGAYDNSGVLIDTGADIGKILFSLDLSAAAVREAEKAGANLIVTHHPAIIPESAISGSGIRWAPSSRPVSETAFPSSPCTSIWTRRREESTIA